MNAIQLLFLSFEALRERRLRAGLTTLMVVMGASLIVSLSGTGSGFTNFVNSQFSSLGANVLILTPRGENIKIDLGLSREIDKMEGVDDVVPYIQLVSTITIQGKRQSAIVVGVEQSKLPLLFPTLSFESGTFVSETDRIGVLLGNEVVRTSEEGGASARLGQTIRLEYRSYDGRGPSVVQQPFVIRGLLNYIGSGIVPADGMVFVSRSQADSLFDRDGSYDGIYVITEGSDSNDIVRQHIRDSYGSDIIIISPQQIANTIQQISSGVYLFISMVALVSLLVASVGIITTIQTSMLERIKEIGLLKALGFNRRLILGLFLFEAMIIGIVGGTIGVLMGVGLSYVMSAFVGGSMRIDGMLGRRGFVIQIVPAFDSVSLLQTWALCVILSMLSGLYPSWQASRLDPVEALRHE